MPDLLHAEILCEATFTSMHRVGFSPHRLRLAGWRQSDDIQGMRNGDLCRFTLDQFFSVT